MPEDLTPLEAALARFAPAAARLDRDALMYAAGRASAGRSWLWPGVATGLAVLSLTLGLRMLTVKPQVIEKPLYIVEPSQDFGPYPGAHYEADGSRYDELLRRASPL